nr:hypothetical protein HmN_000630300 [Hymenolepis microstoma]
MLSSLQRVGTKIWVGPMRVELLEERWEGILSVATTLARLSGSRRVPRRTNFSSFNKIHESIQVFTSSYELKCWSARPCAIDRGECVEIQAEQHLESTADVEKFPISAFGDIFPPPTWQREV